MNLFAARKTINFNTKWINFLFSPCHFYYVHIILHYWHLQFCDLSIFPICQQILYFTPFPIYSVIDQCLFFLLIPLTPLLFYHTQLTNSHTQDQFNRQLSLLLHLSSWNVAREQSQMSRMWWCTLLTPDFQEGETGSQVKASLDNITRCCLKGLGV